MTLVPVGPGGKLEKSEAGARNTKFAGGIKDGGDFLPTLGLKGRQFHIKSGGQTVSLDNRTLDVILVTARDGLSKMFYEGDYEAGAAKKPDCQSVNGVRPDPGVPKPQSDNCATCRMNAWGSKINKVTGKEGKACADTKMLILAPPTLDAEKPLQLSLPAASLKNLSAYIKLLNHNGLAANEVVTTLKFTGDSYPKLDFKYARNLTSDEAQKVKDVEARDDVQATLSEPAAPAVEETATAVQPTVVENVKPAAQAPAEAPPAAAKTTDSPTDEVADVLSRWGASPAK